MVTHNRSGAPEQQAAIALCLGRPRLTVLVALGVSGTSADVILATQGARSKGVSVIAFSGQSGGTPAKHADLVLLISSVDTPIVQEIHLAIGHVRCDLIERALIASPETFGTRRAAGGESAILKV